jgi:Kef-type K+ transport system membrane component KefB
MTAELMQMLRAMKPANILLIQACIVILIPYLLWRTMQLGRWFPLGVVQIFCGVLLGPALFGAFAPELFQTLFGVVKQGEKLVNRTDGIAALATIAVCLFGFLAGADADKELIAKSGRSIALTGIVGMLIGWAFGMMGGALIYAAIPPARGVNTNLFSFSLAYGLVIAVSALPILALILRELSLTQRRIGAYSLASAGLADTLMWVGLAVVLALTGSGSLLRACGIAILGGVLSIGFVKFIAGPILERMMARSAPESAVMTLAALSIFVASAITSITELHPVLGAFVAGVFLPDKVREMAAHSLDRPTSLVLMPFFFLNTGLKTDFAISDINVWMLFVASSFLCVVGKMAGHGIAARMSGEPWPFAAAVGLFLQTKGLMGLIVCVVFLERGIVSPLMFSAAVLMCMFSTGLPVPFARIMVKRFGESMVEGSTSVVPMVRPDEPRVTEDPVAPDKPVLATLVFDNAEYGSAVITSPRVVVGRHSGDDIRINDVRVSRHHALLTLSDGGSFEIHNQTADRSSANPIQINGEILEHTVLKDGDKVLLGGVPLTFRLGKAA